MRFETSMKELRRMNCEEPVEKVFFIRAGNRAGLI